MSIKHCAQLFQKLSLNACKSAIAAKPISIAAIHTTYPKRDLNEFFEEPVNWGKEEIKVGRAWRVTELRLKSNEDLHKLWYILLKEKNMLLTMEYYYKDRYILFPNPERIDKVEESMNNVETAIRERNKAYYLLETGETGERPGQVVYDPLGLKHWRKLTQHFAPKAFNRKWKIRNPLDFKQDECEEFFKLYRERNRWQKKQVRKVDRQYVRGLLRRFPKMDLEYLQEKYPSVDVKGYLQRDYIKGHYEKRSDVTDVNKLPDRKKSV